MGKVGCGGVLGDLVLNTLVCFTGSMFYGCYAKSPCRDRHWKLAEAANGQECTCLRCLFLSNKL